MFGNRSYGIAGLALGGLAGFVIFKLCKRKDDLMCKKCRSRVGVGIGVLVVDDATKMFLVGRRKGSHGSHQWALPGGWLERGESFAYCGLRELEEETGIKEVDLCKIRVLNIAPSNNIEFGSASVFITGHVSKAKSPLKVEIMEKEKCFEWRWISGADNLAGEKLFAPLEYLFTDAREALAAELGN
mmetsp:Transcript_2091/g.3841  ORF Transcript_2091/g.3841 Transcript_2091/m.3841 type:complete len:186 (+) Transcript_2091:58-615(+)